MANTEFSRNLALLVEKAKGDIEKVHRTVLLKIASSVIRKSPVGNPELWLSIHPSFNINGKGKVKFGHTREAEGPVGYVGGRFRANWQFGVGSVNTDTSNPPNGDPESTIGKFVEAVQSVHTGGVIYITNSLPYSMALEYGHSTQSPSGMVRITVQEFAQSLEQALAEVKQ